MRTQRWAPLSGIVFVVLVFVGFVPVGGSTPDSSDSATKITNFYADNHSKEAAAAIIVLFGAIFLAIFVATLRDRFRAGGAETWATLALVGGTVTVAGFLFAVSVHFALADGGDHHFAPEAMVALNGLDSDSFFAFALPLGIMTLGAAVSTLQTNVMPRWLGWVGLVLAIAMFTPAGFFAFGLTGLWIIAVSIVLFRSAEAAPAPAAPAPAA